MIQHFNEQAQVHRYNCLNLLLQVSAVQGQPKPFGGPKQN